MTIPNLLAQLYQTPHPEIKLIEVDQTGFIIFIYGNKETSQKNPGRLILKWSLENNHCPHDHPQSLQQAQHLVSPKKRIQNKRGLVIK